MNFANSNSSEWCSHFSSWLKPGPLFLLYIYIYTHSYIGDIVWKRALTDCSRISAGMVLPLGLKPMRVEDGKVMKRLGRDFFDSEKVAQGSWSKIWVRWLSCCSLSPLGPRWSKTLSGWPHWTRSDKVYFVSTTFTSYFWKGCHVEKTGKKCQRIVPLCFFAAWATFSLGQWSKTYSKQTWHNNAIWGNWRKGQSLDNYFTALCRETSVI